MVTVIFKDLPVDVGGFTVRSIDENGEHCYTICINAHLSEERQAEVYAHEMSHIKYDDFEAVSDVGVGKIETIRHEMR